MPNVTQFWVTMDNFYFVFVDRQVAAAGSWFRQHVVSEKWKLSVWMLGYSADLLEVQEVRFNNSWMCNYLYMRTGME